MPATKLLVCSVFCGSEFDKFWLDLQRRQVAETFGDFDHAVHLSYRAKPELFKDSTIVGYTKEGDKWEHRDGVRALVNYAQQHPHYSGYLVLDSDAFPIAPGWKNTLEYYLARFNKRYAAAIRPENLDTFPHPCVVYAQQAQALWFSYKSTVNLLGQPVTDLACGFDEFFPLLKTNRKSLHPILATIYFDLFYHHGCGSRVFASRATNIGYYDQILARSSNSSEEIFEFLQADPQGFIESLY